ncbi:retrovirus-related Pol polyprotein from transposon 412 [Nephila pilipes]|uniref:Retrovirus-related Pol polyprotein from transposon 412 n=1 Tax=Nephila pilipes TaxID=299642 RepID=A0A8X6TW74_NEPPI|nr:retrovirus-related Pol polyprotein from transposon 412 [Nephila pilipes]
MANAFYTGWISRFGPPLRLTTVQGTQFKASLFDALSKFLGTEKGHNSISSSRKRPSGEVSSAVESSYNGIWKCSVDHSIAHPTHGISSHLKRGPTSDNCGDDLWSSYKASRQFLCASKPSADLVTFLGRLRESMQRLSTPTIQHPDHHTIFGSKDLATCSHVFLRTDSLKNGLQPPYEGPYKVVNRTERVFWILRHGKEVSVNIDRLKPAYIPKEMEDLPVEGSVKKKVSLQPEEVPDSGQEKQRESSSTKNRNPFWPQSSFQPQV